MEGMNVGKNSNKDRQIVEDYVRLYCLEEVLDEVMNLIIRNQPMNPFHEMSQFLLRNTLPEIFQVKISSRVVGFGYFGICVEVISNYGSFTGMTAPPFDIDNISPLVRDHSIAQQRIEELLCPLDPLDFETIDRMLGELTGIDPPIILATSIACLRMTAKFRDREVYSFISELCQREPVIPLPVTTVLARGIGSPEQKEYQYFHIFPLSSSSLSGALEILTEFSHRLQRIVAGRQFFDTAEKIETLSPTNIPSPETLGSFAHPIDLSYLWNGCLSVRGMSLTRCLKLLNTAIEEDGEMLAVRPSIDCHSSSLVQITNSTSSHHPKLSYSYLHPSEPTTSIDTAETLVMLWKNYEMVSLEDIFHPSDRLAYQHFKLRVAETIAAIRRDDAANELPYAQKGVGMDGNCPVQIVVDQLCRTPEDLLQLHRDYPPGPSPSVAGIAGGGMNTVKVRLEKFLTISRAIDFCKTAQEIKWNLQIGCSEESPETPDPFLADFAVGVGAHQFLGGGLQCSEYCCKYNRLLEIQQETEGRVPFVGMKYRVCVT